MTDMDTTTAEGTATEPAAGAAPAPAEPAAGAGAAAQGSTASDQGSEGTPQQEGGASAGESDKPSTEKDDGHKGLLVADEDSKSEGENKDAGTLGAPEGDYEIKAPEGQELDSTVTGELGKVAKELNLSQDAVQKIVDRMTPMWQKQAVARVDSLRKAWTEQSKADKEFGGNEFDANIKAVSKVYTRFTTPELRSLLEESGLNCHPEVIRMFHRLTKATSEGRYINGTGNGSVPSGDIRNFYKGMNP